MKLSDDQQIAIDKILDFIYNSEDIAFSLIGEAGTGKSFCIKELIGQLLKKFYYDFILCAPTHKAKFVLQRFTGEPTVTVHQLLSLSPNLDIMNLDLRMLDFFSKSKPVDQIPYNGLVICDEGSMINDDLYDHLIKKCTEKKSKILFILDDCQIQPVGKHDVSKTVSNLNCFKLTTNFRQSEDNALLPMIRTARNNIITSFKDISAPLGSCYVYSSAQEMINESKDHFNKMIESEDILYAKLLTYTNSRVSTFNKAIRKVIFSDNCNNEYCDGEILMCYDNIKHNKHEYFNSLEYVVKNVGDIITKYLPGYNWPVYGYNLEIEDKVYGGISNVFILTRNGINNFTSLALSIENYRQSAINSIKGSKDSKNYWKKYYDLVNSFASPINLEFDGRLIKSKTFDYGYATTIHKSQGSSHNIVFLDNNSLQFCQDLNERRQLQYVGLSRTSKDIYILK